MGFHSSLVSVLCRDSDADMMCQPFCLYKEAVVVHYFPDLSALRYEAFSASAWHSLHISEDQKTLSFFCPKISWYSCGLRSYGFKLTSIDILGKIRVFCRLPAAHATYCYCSTLQT
jgi:hypothetical protein